MSDDYGSNFLTIEDDEGHEFELEEIMSLEHNGESYTLFLPADMEEDDPDYGYIILRITEENGEELFNSVDDPDELETIYNRFMDVLFTEEADSDASDEEPEE